DTILPVTARGLGPAVALDPPAQRVGRCPDRLFLAEPPERSTGGVVHHVHQTALRTALLQPRMETAVHLHQFAEVPLALPPLPMRRSEERRVGKERRSRGERDP